MLQAAQKYPRYATSAPALLVHGSGRTEAVPLGNISLGGAFVCTPAPPPAGDRVHLRLAVNDGEVDTAAVVVHAVDGAHAAPRHRVAGAGLAFDRASPAGRVVLERFIGRLAAEAAQVARSSGQWRLEPRFTGPGRVRVSVPSREQLQELVCNNISRGGMFVVTAAPPLPRTMVEVELATVSGTLMLRAEVVHVVDGPGAGAGLQFLPLTAEQQQALLRLLEGQPALAAGVSAPSVDLRQSALRAARQLLDSVDHQDGHAALGIAPDASAAVIRSRAAELREQFTAAMTGATPPQSARLVAAVRSLARVERGVLHQAALQARATGAELQVINAALETVAPPSPPVPAAQAPARGQQRDTALDLVHSAAVCLDAGMRSEAARRVREAVRLNSDGDVVAGAVQVLVKAGAAADAARFARRVLPQLERNEAFLRAAEHAAEAAGDLILARRVLEQLAAMLPRDVGIAERLALARTRARQ